MITPKPTTTFQPPAALIGSAPEVTYQVTSQSRPTIISPTMVTTYHLGVASSSASRSLKSNGSAELSGELSAPSAAAFVPRLRCFQCFDSGTSAPYCLGMLFLAPLYPQWSVNHDANNPTPARPAEPRTGRQASA